MAQNTVNALLLNPKNSRKAKQEVADVILYVHLKNGKTNVMIF